VSGQKEFAEFGEMLGNLKKKFVEQIEYEKNGDGTLDYFKNKRPDRFYLGPFERKKSEKRCIVTEKISKGDTIVIEKGILSSSKEYFELGAAFLTEINNNPELKCLYRDLFPSDLKVLDEPIQKHKEFSEFIQKEKKAFEEKNQKTWKNLSSEEANSYFMKSILNAQKLPDARLGVYPFSSHFNHSCKPNTMIYFLHDQVLAKAIHDIPAGEEILISYVPLTFPKKQRSDNLRKYHGFECECQVCKDNTEWLTKMIQIEDFTCPHCMASSNKDYKECCIDYSFEVVISSSEKELKRPSPNFEGIKDYSLIFSITIEHMPTLLLILKYLKLIHEIKEKNPGIADEL
jgi:hypothetical protein